MRCLLLALSLLLSACSPTLNWRDVEVGAQTRMQFPCRPERAERQVVLAGVPSQARMVVCDAGGLSWSATVFEVRDPVRLTSSLRELRLNFVDRLGGRGGQATVRPVQIAGMTPSDEAHRVTVPGRAEAVFVARGLQVFQLVVMARSDAPRQWADSAEEFLGSVRWPG
jgi:hypothetical protein